VRLVVPLVAVVAVAAAVAVSSCGRRTQPPVAGQTLADSAEQVMFDVRTLLTNTGVKRGEMFADTVYVFDDQTRFVMRVVRATFNTETGAPNGTLRGDRGIYRFREKVLEGYGNVVVTSTDGRRLVSNHLKYSQLSNEISSDSAFTLTQQDRVQRGIGFTSDPNITVFRCHRACSGSANVPLGELKP
jgi:LPS export ABC transporter protein LptC